MRYKFLALILFSGFLRAQGDFVSTVLSTQPIAYWRLDTPGASSIVGGYSLTEVGSPSYTQAGGGAPISGFPTNIALSLNGSNPTPQYAKTALAGGIAGTGSIMAWVKLSQLPSVTGAYAYIAGESQAGNDFDLQFQNDNRLYLYTGSGENTNYSPDTTKLTNTWHLIVATFVGGQQGSRAIYWDGALAAKDSGGVNAATKTSAFSIGYSLVFSGRDFGGLIDEVGVWNRALSAAEVTAIYKSATIPISSTILSAIPSFLGNAGVSSGMYVEIYGSNFSNHSRSWAASDFSGSVAPVSLDGVSATVNYLPASIFYISPGQINVVLPDDPAVGPVPLRVSTATGISNSIMITKSAVSPALLTTAQFKVNQKQYIAALTPDFSSFIGNPGMIAGVNFVLAKPGDTIVLYALGCGPTAPATPAGVVAQQGAYVALPYALTIGGVPANVTYAGLAAGLVGLYQLNVTVPNVASGDQPIQLTVNNVSNAQNLFITIGQ